jgi:hypothetical protein
LVLDLNDNKMAYSNDFVHEIENKMVDET